MIVMKSTTNLVDEFIQFLGEHQYIILMVVVSFLISPVVLVVFLLTLFMLRRFERLTLLVFMLSSVAMLIITTCGYLPRGLGIVTKILIFHQLHVIGIERIVSEAIYSITLGAFLSSLASFIIGEELPLNKELKRIGQGISAENEVHNEKRLQKALSRISIDQVSNGAVLGIDKRTYEQVVLTDEDANLHLLAVGTTGSGKTTAIANIVESAIFRGLPVFYVDGKGDLSLAKRVGEYAKKCNRQFYLFSMVGESCTYNPLSTGGFTSKKDRIIELRNWSEEHYKKLAESYLQSVLKLLDSLGIEVDLISLTKALRFDELNKIFRKYKHVDKQQLLAFLESIYKHIEGLIAELNNLVESEIGYLFHADEHSLRLSRAFDENAVVYFCLQPLQFPSYAETLGKLIINDLKSLFSTQLNYEKPKRSYVFLDEFSVFSGEQVINLINQGRSAGVHAILATQSISDLESMNDKSFAGRILNNCNNFIVQRQNSPSDAEILANLIGTMKSFQITSQIPVDIQTIKGSVREVNQFICHPDKLKSMCIGEAVILKKKKHKIFDTYLRKGNI